MKNYALCFCLLLATVSLAKTRPPTVDPNTCPYPYNMNVASIADPMAWLPADVNVSVVSTINVWNRQGREVAIAIDEVVMGSTGEWVIQPIEHMLVNDNENPIPDPNGGFNQSFTWGFTPAEGRIYYLLFTAATPEKPNWKTDKRIMLVYSEPEDVPVLWVQDVPLLTTHNAQRLWQAATKAGKPMTKPTLVRLAKRGG